MTRLRPRLIVILALLCLMNCGCPDRVSAQTTAGPVPVKVFVDVAAKKGNASTLDASALTVSVDGKAAQLLSVRPAKDDKLSFAVMVDISGSGRNQREDIDKAAVKVFEALTHENSLGYLVLFNTQTYPTKRPILPSEAQSLLNKISFSGGTSLYDSVAQVASDILSKSANSGTPRRLIIVLSDGQDNYSKMTLGAMQKAVQREGVSVFLLSQDARDTPSKTRDALIDDFARNTGGDAIIDETMLAGVPTLLTEISGQVELTFAPPVVTLDELHSFSLKTSEKHVSIAVPDHILIPVSR